MKLLCVIGFGVLLCTGCIHEPPESATSASATNPTASDPYLWLEDVHSERALQWVGQQNRACTNQIERSPGFESLKQRLLAILDSKEKIPTPDKLGKYYYNFWQDDQHVRGLWRRTSPAEFRKPQPQWETVLDLDQLAAAENENWVWSGCRTLHPEHERGLIQLTRGGGDTGVVREFDLLKKEFVTNGFAVPEAKSVVMWRDENTVYVGTDFGPDSLTTAGYPRTIKEWRRGTPLSAARTVYEGQANDVLVAGYVDHDHGHTYEWIWRAITSLRNEYFLRKGDEWVRIDKPDDARLSTFFDQILIQLRTDWPVEDVIYPAGALLAAPLKSYLAGERSLVVLFTPGERKSLAGFARTKNYLLLNELENINSRLYALKLEGSNWSRTRLSAPEFGSLRVWGVDEDESDEFFLDATDFLTPTSLQLGIIGQDTIQLLKTSPAFFSTSGLRINQFEAVSKDGTRIPYYRVNREDIALNGRNPTLLTAYGGFGKSLTPYYDAEVGAAWLERGGVFVVANLRGGGEFGPKWHQAAIKTNRQRAYDDFIAVAEDLVHRKVTSPRFLGIMGASNGGLLVGVAFTQRPDLFRAVVCQVPLLDMERFHKLGAGASWIGEYGDPNSPEEQAALLESSPYHHVEKGRRYPRVLFTTSTRDDRVHPGHARKMVAKMTAQGHHVLYYENVEGGHAGAADNRQAAYMSALAYTFLLRELR